MGAFPDPALQEDLRATEEAWLFLLLENPLIHLVELNLAIQVVLLFKQKVSSYFLTYVRIMSFRQGVK